MQYDQKEIALEFRSMHFAGAYCHLPFVVCWYVMLLLLSPCCRLGATEICEEIERERKMIDDILYSPQHTWCMRMRMYYSACPSSAARLHIPIFYVTAPHFVRVYKRCSGASWLHYCGEALCARDRYSLFVYSMIYFYSRGTAYFSRFLLVVREKMGKNCFPFLSLLLSSSCLFIFLYVFSYDMSVGLIDIWPHSLSAATHLTAVTCVLTYVTYLYMRCSCCFFSFFNGCVFTAHPEYVLVGDVG